MAWSNRCQWCNSTSISFRLPQSFWSYIDHSILVKKLKEIKVPNNIDFLSDRSQRVKLSKDFCLSRAKYHLECPRGPSWALDFSSSWLMTCLFPAFTTCGNTLTIPWYRRLYPKVRRASLESYWTCVTTFTSPHVRESMTVSDSGFHPVDSGFRVLDSGFQKGLDSKFFSVLMLFLAFRFRVRILLYWKTLFRMHNKFVFFFDL